jgi:predicted KAP-like P-loop ATPase
MILHDNETAVDLLYYESIASTITELISDSSNEPITVGVHGDWGAGKSSILAMIQQKYLGDENVLCLHFNGWLFQGFDDAKLVLLEKVITEVQDAQSTPSKAKDLAKTLLRRINWLKVAKTASNTAYSIATGLPSPELITNLKKSAANIIENPLEALSADNLQEMAQPFSDFINQESEDTPSIAGEMHAFREEFEKLLSEAKVDKLVVLIDDLDRCLPTTTIETLEAIRLFLFVPNTAFIVAADEAMIEYAVKQHFPDLPNTVGALSYARNYLEKLIQVPFRIPALGPTETLTYTALLLTLRSLGENSEGFRELKKASKEAIKKPWLGQSLSPNQIKEAIDDPDQLSKVLESLSLSEQIGPILSEGTEGNPRQIKRFINSLMLREQIAKARGFSKEISTSVLAKIMLIEYFSSEFYREVGDWVNNTTDGKPPELAQLEKAKGKSDESSSTSNLKQDEWKKRWSRISPTLDKVDLRPYLFITRDKKNRYGPTLQLGHLQDLAENLLGSDMTVAGLKAEIQNLGTPEAEKLFQYLSTTVINSGNLQDQPPGFSGLKAIIKTHTFLQDRYCSLLEGLEVKQLGTWIAQPIEHLSDDPSKSKYIQILTTWSEQTENTALALTASQNIKIGKKG